MATVYPVLQHSQLFDFSHYAARYLVEAPDDVPLVTYLRVDDNGTSRYVSWESVQRSKRPGLKALNAKAMTDLTYRPNRPAWNRSYHMHRGQEIMIIERTGDYLTASDILDPEILQIAHHCLKSSDFYIGIPHSGYMVAALDPGHLSHAFFNAYDEAVKEKAQVFGSVFRVMDEQLVDIVPVNPCLSGPEFKLAGRSKVMCFTFPYRGDFNLLRYSILNDLPQIIPGYLRRSGFSGNVLVEIPTSTQKFNLSECRQLADLESQMNLMARERGWVTYECTCITVELLFQQKNLARRGIRTSVLDLLPGV